MRGFGIRFGNMIRPVRSVIRIARGMLLTSNGKYFKTSNNLYFDVVDA
jgi:hypothetical protein